MPPSEPLRVFLSYARKDGVSLAQRLQSDLKERGFAAWLDTQRITSGATWTSDIERALDDAEFVLALMTAGSYVSEICRAEQLRALRKDKCVIPLKAQPGADIPLHLEAKNYRDFTTDSCYPQAFTELLADLHAGNGVALKPEFRETSYVTVPPLPVNFVERPEALAALRDALISDDGCRHIALTALQGMGGIGKTVLSQALCRDEVVQQAFPDGVVWITIGKESAFDALTRMREVGRALGDDLSRYENELAAKNRYRSTIRKKAALIVVDDVWRSSDLEPLLAEDSPRSRLLFTTRDVSIAAAVGAREHVADLLTAEQSREVFARWSRTEITSLPPIATQLIHECGQLPLALSMVGAMLRGKPPTYWKTVLEHLRNADLDKITAQFPDYPYTDVLRAIQVSVDSLDATLRTRYLALAVLLEEMAAAPHVQRCLWGVDENQAAETVEQFVGLSLAQRDQPEGSIRLHDLQLDYVRAQYHDPTALALEHSALLRSLHVVRSHPEQFASQMVGRLLAHQAQAGVAAFLKDLDTHVPRPWLRPLRPVLDPAGGAVIRVLEDQMGGVNAVALSADGKRAVAGSNDGTLQVWYPEANQPPRVLYGHKASVYTVALSADGNRAVSGSADHTVRVWDLEGTRPPRILEGHMAGVNAVALSAHGSRAISGSADLTVRVWDLEGNQPPRVLEGHTNPVKAVALSADGKRAIAGSDSGEYSLDHTLRVWDLESNEAPRVLKGWRTEWRGTQGTINAVALSADGKRAVLGSSPSLHDDTLRVWDLDSDQPPRTLEGHKAGVNSVALSADGKRAVFGSEDHTVRVWNLDSSRSAQVLEGHTQPVNAVAVSADGKRAVSVSYDRFRFGSEDEDYTVRVWDLEGKQRPPNLEVLTNPVNAVALSADGRRALSFSGDAAGVWDLESNQPPLLLEGAASFVRAAALSADGKRAVFNSRRDLLVWDLESNQPPRVLEGHTDSVWSVALSADGRRAVSGSSDFTIRVWDLENNQPPRVLEGHLVSAPTVALSADGQRAVSGSHDKTLRVWNLEGNQPPRVLEIDCRDAVVYPHCGDVVWVALSADGRRVVFVSGIGLRTLRVWDLEGNQAPRVLEDNSGRAWRVAMSADGQRAVSVSNDKTLRVWDLTDGKCLAAFTCDDRLSSCAWGGRRIAAFGDHSRGVHFFTWVE
jgi:WD40 repeat protein